MEFKQFNSILQGHIGFMTNEQTHLFTVDVDKEELWNLYLDSFPAGTNEVFRERREFDCNCCKQFIRALGNVVAINSKNEIVTIWDFETNSDKYQLVVDALAAHIKSKPINGVFVTDTRSFGTEKTHDLGPISTVAKPLTILSWYHFNATLPDTFQTVRRFDINEKRGEYDATRQVFGRSLTELKTEATNTVLELIGQNSLYRGAEWKTQLQALLKAQKAYKRVAAAKKETYLWKQSATVNVALGRIRNSSIGTLLINLSEGMDLNQAVGKYEAVVAPTNYKRPKAIYTKSMIQQAQKTVQEMGFESSLGRRYAYIDDITVNNVLHANRDAVKAMTGNVFEEMMEESPVNPKTLDKVEAISAEKFIVDVLPTAKEVEVFMENKHSGNLVSLIAPQDKDSKTMFKWNNNFSWAYNGNVADSMKEHVKAAGGKVDGVLRFSIQWNDDNDNKDDLDAHCKEPSRDRWGSGAHIYFSNKRHVHPSSGMLDVDIMHPGSKVAVENIIYTDLNKMPKGTYKFWVNNYSKRGGTKSGFTAEIEFDGQVHSFSYDKPLKNQENIQVAEITLDAQGNFSINKKLSSTSSINSKEAWSLKTNQFHPVSVAMFSPNYWDEQDGIGNKHLFFMLKNCINDETPNGFFNEYLNQDLMKHKRVFEALGSKMKVQETDNQLSGLGFSITKRNSVICRVKGAFTRVLRVEF